MNLEYVGHKPVISHTGVDFSIGKEDKYVYIEPAAQMIDFLNNLDTTKKAMLNPKKVLNEAEVLSTLHKYRPNFDKFYDKKISNYEKKIYDEIEEVNQQNTLKEVEKEVLINNLKLMKDYRLQRVTNKLVYEELINGCVELIMEKRVVEIDMPFSLTFVHVATSFETSLAFICKAVVANVEVRIDREQPYTRLTIHGFNTT